MSYSSQNRFIDPDKAFKHACRVLNYTPMDAIARQENKDIAWEEIKSTNRTLQLRGLETLLHCWFDRSLETAMRNGYWQGHPGKAEYGRMICLKDESSFPASLATRFRHAHGAYLPGHIPPDSSYWEPLSRVL